MLSDINTPNIICTSSTSSNLKERPSEYEAPIEHWRGHPEFSYTLLHDPLPGWKKEIRVNPNHSVKFNQKGNLLISYSPPDGTEPLKTREEIIGKLSTLYEKCDSMHIVRKFALHKPYCVCHQVSDNRIYTTCKYGKAGCNGKFHHACVGKATDWTTKGAVCPLCTNYLNSKNLICEYKQYELFFIDAHDPVRPVSLTIIDGIMIEEYDTPFKVWGIIGMPRTRPRSSRHEAIDHKKKMSMRQNSGDQKIRPSKANFDYGYGENDFAVLENDSTSDDDVDDEDYKVQDKEEEYEVIMHKLDSLIYYLIILYFFSFFVY